MDISKNYGTWFAVTAGSIMLKSAQHNLRNADNLNTYPSDREAWELCLKASTKRLCNSCVAELCSNARMHEFLRTRLYRAGTTLEQRTLGENTSLSLTSQPKSPQKQNEKLPVLQQMPESLNRLWISRDAIKKKKSQLSKAEILIQLHHKPQASPQRGTWSFSSEVDLFVKKHQWQDFLSY